ncbi:sulfurtransferase, partial [Bordetella pertussis]|uniref:sulfurtransferase n=1 Tax=Bordetella pertussis TaxID=520 RepID=UPI000AA79840
MTMTLISAADLTARLDAGGVRVFDVRHDLADHAAGRRAYEQGHIAGARYLDHEAELAALRWMGHERVAVLDGGWQAWTAAGLPTE